MPQPSWSRLNNGWQAARDHSAQRGICALFSCLRALFVEANRHASKSYFALSRSPSLRAFADAVLYDSGKQQKRLGTLLVNVATQHHHALL